VMTETINWQLPLQGQREAQRTTVLLQERTQPLFSTTDPSPTTCMGSAASGVR
jgi:hypothetical protein